MYLYQYHVIKSSQPKIQLLNCKNLYITRFSKRNGKLVRKKNLSGNVQVIKIVFVDNKNLNKIIHLSANSLQKSRYSNEAKATFSTLAKVDITTNGICIFEKEMPTKSRIWKWLELKWQTFSHSQWHFFPLRQMGIYGNFLPYQILLV